MLHVLQGRCSSLEGGTKTSIDAVEVDKTLAESAESTTATLENHRFRLVGPQRSCFPLPGIVALFFLRRRSIFSFVALISVPLFFPS